ncbi:MAG: MFS transporter [Actinomycetes bacterium]
MDASDDTPAPDRPAEQLVRRLTPPERFLLVGLVCMVTVVATESMAVTTVMPLVERDLGQLSLYGWAFSAFFIGNLVGSVVGGRATDRVAPVVPLGVGIGVFVAGLLVGGLAPSMPVLVLGRLLQGVGAGAVPAVMYVCVGRGFPAALRPKVFAVTSTAWVVPSLVAPLGAAWVAQAVGWRWVFLGLVPVAVVVAALSLLPIRRVGPGSVDPGRPATPVSRVVLLAAGAAALLAGLTARTWWVLVPLVGAGLALGVPAFRALTPPGTMTARPVLPAAVLLRGVLTFSFFGADAYISLALSSVRGTSTQFAGFVLASASLTWTAGSWFQAHVHRRWGEARLVRLGGSVLALGLVLLASCLSSAVPVGVWFVGSLLIGFGMGTAFAPISTTTLAAAEPGREGAATSALQLSDVLGTALGTGLAGVVVGLGAVGTAAPLVAVYLGTACTALVVAACAGRLRVDRVPAPVASSTTS